MFALIIILSIVVLISWIWLAIVMFKQSAVWGIPFVLPVILSVIGVFTQSPVLILVANLAGLAAFILSIVFAVMHWQAAKKPFLTYIISSIAIIAVAITGGMAALLGDKNLQDMAKDGEQLEDQMSSGEISEEEAKRRMLEMFGMKVPPELQKKEAGPSTTEDEISKLTEQLENNNTPEPAAPPVPQRVEVFKPIKLSQAKKHVGQMVQVMTIDGVVKQGILTAVRYDRLVLQRDYRGGTFSFDVQNRMIKSVEVKEFVEY